MPCTRSSPVEVSQFMSHGCASTKRRSALTSLSPIKRPRSTSVVSDDAVDHIIALKTREEDGYHFFDTFQPSLDANWRGDICEWIYNVVESDTWAKLGTKVLTWEVAAAAISYFDRYIATYSSTVNAPSEDRVLLTSLASLRIASKLFSNAIIGMDFFLYIGRGRFSAFDIEEMEEEILFKLSWRVHRPTAVDFVVHLLALLPNKNLQNDLRRRSTRLLKKEVTCDPFFVHIPTSVIAFASILNAAEDNNLKGSFDFSVHFLSSVASIFPSLNLDDLQIQECMCRLREMEMNSAISKRAAASGYIKAIS